MARLARTVRDKRSNDRMAPLLDLIRRRGSLLPRRSALKHPLVWHRKASTGITASIAKLTESAGTCARPGRTEQGVASSKAIYVCLSLLRQTPRFGLGLVVLMMMIDRL
jgi:hypothetical protein